MGKSLPHSRLIIAAAREALKPLGLAQKGRSRTWLDDRGWWVGVVEFQASDYTRGSYLNVRPNWLWNPKPYLSFDFAGSSDVIRGKPFIEFSDEDQFRAEAAGLATLAADAVLEYRRRFRTVRAAADHLYRSSPRSGQAMLDTAIALGLSGQTRRATLLLRRCLKSQGPRRGFLGSRHRRSTRKRIERTTRDLVEGLEGATGGTVEVVVHRSSRTESDSGRLLRERVERLLPLVHDAPAFQEFILREIALAREVLGLSGEFTMDIGK